MDINRLFSKNLKKWRKIKGISQKILAEKCNSSHSYIRQIESGNGQPSFTFLSKIANALQIEPYLLFFDESINSSESAHIKYIESLQRKLILSVSSDIQNTFTELKKH